MKRTSSQQQSRLVPFSCCQGDLCFFNVNTRNKPEISHSAIIEYMTIQHNIVSGYSLKELKEILETQVRTVVSNNEKLITPKNRSSLNFNVTISNKNISLCETCFLHLWRVEKHGFYPAARTYMRMKATAKANKLGDDLQKHIKVNKNKKECYFDNINEALIYFEKNSDLSLKGLTFDHFAYACLPQKDRWLQAFSWIKAFFALECESPPNNGNISELPAALYSKQSVFDLYHTEMRFDHPSDEHEPLNYNEFVVLWLKIFPNVKCKKYQEVTGKCDTCCTLYELMKVSNSYADFQKLEQFKVLHRMEVTTQKAAYYANRRLAEVQPETYMSIIIDGMQQSHSELPYFGNQKEYPYRVVQHIEGCKQHGFGNCFYRTFPHVKHGVNLTLTCLVDQIAMRQKYCLDNNLKFPTHLFLQIDGGPENTAKPFLAFCQLLLKLRIFDKIEVNRLPVGHTHEDIDALFGTLWKHVRSEVIKTPQDFKNYVLKSFNNDE